MCPEAEGAPESCAPYRIEIICACLFILALLSEEFKLTHRGRCSFALWSDRTGDLLPDSSLVKTKKGHYETIASWYTIGRSHAGAARHFSAHSRFHDRGFSGAHAFFHGGGFHGGGSHGGHGR
jgi:hypothetical protein